MGLLGVFFVPWGMGPVEEIWFVALGLRVSSWISTFDASTWWRVGVLTGFEGPKTFMFPSKENFSVRGVYIHDTI